MPPTRFIQREILAGIFLFVASFSSVEAQESSSPDEKAPIRNDAALLQKKTFEWIETRRLIGEEAAAWTEEKATLGELNAIRKKETGQLGEFIQAAGARVDELAGKKGALAEESVALKSWRSQLESEISSLETELKPLIPRFPPILREKMEESLLRIESSERDTPLQNRARDVLLVLQACLEFQNAVTVASEVHEIDGQRHEVEVLYLGLNQAWYVDPSDRFSGQGIPGAEGWTWKQDNRLASSVRSAIEVQTRRAVPTFVELSLANGKEATK